MQARCITMSTLSSTAAAGTSGMEAIDVLLGGMVAGVVRSPAAALLDHARSPAKAPVGSCICDLFF
jgi:hypothetical protein